MKKVGRILVATDGSATSARAVKAAIALAAATRASLTALHVIPIYIPPAFVDGVFPMAELYSTVEYKQSTEAYSRRLLAKVEKAARAAKVRCEVIGEKHESPWRTIIRIARGRKCDVIVMASHGRRGIEALLLGSETQKVLTHSKIPVLVVR